MEDNFRPGLARRNLFRKLLMVESFPVKAFNSPKVYFGITSSLRWGMLEKLCEVSGSQKS
jgi:hypothetical protein